MERDIKYEIYRINGRSKKLLMVRELVFVLLNYQVRFEAYN